MTPKPHGWDDDEETIINFAPKALTTQPSSMEHPASEINAAEFDLPIPTAIGLARVQEDGGEGMDAMGSSSPVLLGDEPVPSAVKRASDTASEVPGSTEIASSEQSLSIVPNAASIRHGDQEPELYRIVPVALSSSSPSAFISNRPSVDGHPGPQESTFEPDVRLPAPAPIVQAEPERKLLWWQVSAFADTPTPAKPVVTEPERSFSPTSSPSASSLNGIRVEPEYISVTSEVESASVLPQHRNDAESSITNSVESPAQSAIIESIEAPVEQSSDHAERVSLRPSADIDPPTIMDIPIDLGRDLLDMYPRPLVTSIEGQADPPVAHDAVQVEQAAPSPESPPLVEFDRLSPESSPTADHDVSSPQGPLEIDYDTPPPPFLSLDHDNGSQVATKEGYEQIAADNSANVTATRKVEAVAWLAILSSPTADERIIYRLDAPRMELGRLPELPIYINDMTVSSRHSAIRYERVDEQFEFVIYDLSSTNGSIVNGVSIQTAVLQDNDRIRVGETELVFKKVGEALPALQSQT